MRRDVTAALRLTLQGHLSLRKSRLESFCVLVVGVLLSRTVNLSHLACMFPTRAAIGSNYRRLQRFFEQVEPSSAAGTGNSCASEIDVPQREDAPAIARCFLAVYGHAYVHPEVFSPHHYWDKVERGELIPVVARDGQGEIVGHLALERGPGTQVAERGEAVVLPAHRSHGLLERMTERLSEVAVRHNLQGIYAEPVTIHTYSQRNDERAGMPVCAVLLGVNPDTFHPKGMPCVAGQRQSYLRTFRFLRPPAPRTIHAPEPYREVLHRIYASLGADVTEAAEPGSAAPQSCTSIRVNGRGYGVIAFEQIGVSAAIEL